MCTRSAFMHTFRFVTYIPKKGMLKGWNWAGWIVFTTSARAFLSGTGIFSPSVQVCNGEIIRCYQGRCLTSCWGATGLSPHCYCLIRADVVRLKKRSQERASQNYLQRDFWLRVSFRNYFSVRKAVDSTVVRLSYSRRNGASAEQSQGNPSVVVLTFLLPPQRRETETTAEGTGSQVCSAHAALAVEGARPI